MPCDAGLMLTARPYLYMLAAKIVRYVLLLYRTYIHTYSHKVRIRRLIHAIEYMWPGGFFASETIPPL